MNPVAAWLNRARQASVRVEPLDGRHADRLADLHAGAFLRPWSALEFERLIAEDTVLADGLFLGGCRAPDGFVLSRCAADEAEVLSVALAPEARGRGCARPLLSVHLRNLALRRVGIAHLEVDEGNAPALALYGSLGFREVGRRPAYYPSAGGRRQSALIMSLDL